MDEADSECSKQISAGAPLDTWNSTSEIYNFATLFFVMEKKKKFNYKHTHTESKFLPGVH